MFMKLYVTMLFLLYAIRRTVKGTWNICIVLLCSRFLNSFPLVYLTMIVILKLFSSTLNSKAYSLSKSGMQCIFSETKSTNISNNMDTQKLNVIVDHTLVEYISLKGQPYFGGRRVFIFENNIIEWGKIGTVLLSPECGLLWVMSTSTVEREAFVLHHLAFQAWAGAA